jgi:ADP-ribose pyrophosphatase YjhB (NUDIX family)
VVSLKGGRVVTLPKGQVEPGERYAETAVREVREETGVEAAPWPL